MPDEYTDECEDCGSYNDLSIKILCRKCIDERIDKWVDESNKLFEQSDIKRLKEMFA